MQPTLDKLIDEEKIDVLYVDVFEHPEVAKRCGVRNVPTLMVDGKIVTLDSLLTGE